MKNSGPFYIKPALPKLGLRIVKTQVAVFITCLLYVFMPGRAPFYALIACIITMRADLLEAKRAALTRTLATLVGGTVGYFVLLVQLRFLFPVSQMLGYLFAVLFVLPVIYITIAFKIPESSYIACVVLFGVTIVHSTNGLSALSFVFNRVIDTEIGIFVSLAVNSLPLTLRKNANILLLLRLENTLANAGGALEKHVLFPVSQLWRQGARVVLFSAYPPATALSLCGPLHPPLPVIALEGACAYSLAGNQYCYSLPFTAQQAGQLTEFLHGQGLHFFPLGIQHNLLHIYFTGLQSPAEQSFFEAQRVMPHQNFIHGPMPAGMPLLACLVIQPPRQIAALRQMLETPEGPAHPAARCTPLPLFATAGCEALLLTSPAATPATAQKLLAEAAGPAFSGVSAGPLVQNMPASKALRTLRHSLRARPPKTGLPPQ